MATRGYQITVQGSQTGRTRILYWQIANDVKVQRERLTMVSETGLEVTSPERVFETVKFSVRELVPWYSGC